MKPSDQYLKIVEWSDEDGCYVGTCPSLFDGGVHGSDESVVYKKLVVLVEEWIEIHEKDGIPLPESTANKKFSGKFLVRLNPDVHKMLYIQSLRRGVSLNALCSDILKKSAT
jgi:predicted HicB family RNase H-like nuclease